MFTKSSSSSGDKTDDSRQRPPAPPQLPPVRTFKVVRNGLVAGEPKTVEETVYAHNIGESDSGSIYFTTVILFDETAVPVTRRGFAKGVWLHYEEIVLDKTPGIIFQ